MAAPQNASIPDSVLQKATELGVQVQVEATFKSAADQDDDMPIHLGPFSVCRVTKGTTVWIVQIPKHCKCVFHSKNPKQWTVIQSAEQGCMAKMGLHEAVDAQCALQVAIALAWEADAAITLFWKDEIELEARRNRRKRHSSNKTGDKKKIRESSEITME